jgi:hypothetical protein
MIDCTAQTLSKCLDYLPAADMEMPSSANLPMHPVGPALPETQSQPSQTLSSEDLTVQS